MLGNFSFGNYFKEDAIELAWNLITKTFSVPSEKLIITVFMKMKRHIKFGKKFLHLMTQKF